MSEQKALFLTSRRGPFAIGTAPIPKPGRGQLLVKIEATALNPVDWKIQAYEIFIDDFPAVLGTDIAGTVEELGEGVTGFVKGDRVLSQGLYGDNEQCSFQQYTLTNAVVTAKIPDNVSFGQAATVPLGLATAAIGLFNRKAKTGSVGLYPPWEEGGEGKYKGKPIVILGGASSVGQYGVQNLAKYAGFSPIISTASLWHTGWLKDRGATHLVDRHLHRSITLAEIGLITEEPIEVVFDAVSETGTQTLGYSLLAPGGCLLTTLPTAVDQEVVKITPERRIEEVYGNVNVAESRELGISLYSKLTELLAKEVIRPNRVKALPNGLEGIISGLQELRKGVSGIKLVAFPQETKIRGTAVIRK
ncbi:GroES-like protein [Laetiporus sulphureus 93-53]|uniref:GroES-like protein n=1 Tax=Laetiporus sulphureus 93-53 TaxID=1314785 RepID=A0A165B9N9_9APHY|nr:GroES-like protein [Laetiporus sulphureus 93-53]KZT00565.1 GroES-like protein [Laetiporus sulphureus 93-53]